jgi:phosphotransferase system HPr-like phosphotransfer protein
MSQYATSVQTERARKEEGTSVGSSPKILALTVKHNQRIYVAVTTALPFLVAS